MMKLRLLLTAVMTGGMLFAAAPGAAACDVNVPPLPHIGHILDQVTTCVEEKRRDVQIVRPPDDPVYWVLCVVLEACPS